MSDVGWMDRAQKVRVTVLPRADTSRNIPRKPATIDREPDDFDHPWYNPKSPGDNERDDHPKDLLPVLGDSVPDEIRDPDRPPRHDPRHDVLVIPILHIFHCEVRAPRHDL